MDLYTLCARIEHEMGKEREHSPVKIMTPDGEYDILSLNWDEDGQEWAIIGD